MTSKEGLVPKGAMLRRPVQVVKRRSGPLEDALDELNRIESADGVNKKEMSQEKLDPSTWKTSDQIYASAFGRRRTMMREKEKKRERWLLTRKTWKYMTDAGRKLLPEGTQNRKEDIPSIEAHFQQVCASEIRFVLWRRKQSYPGAIRNSKPRLKHLIQRSRHVQSLSTIEQEAANNTCQTMELLQSYLKLDERFKTTTLLGSKTIRPDQTASPSAQRPGCGPRQSQAITNISLRGPGFITTTKTKVAEPHLSETEQLLMCLTQSAQLGNLPIKPEKISSAILEDKVLLKQLYNTLKKQQLHRILSKHSSLLSKPKSNLTHTVSLSSLNYFGGNPKEVFVSGSDFTENKRINDFISTKIQPIHSHHCSSKNISPPIRVENDASKNRKKTPPTTLGLLLSPQEAINPVLPTRWKGHIGVGKQFNTCGTQTNFIQLSEIKRLAEEYKSHRCENVYNQDGRIGTPTATDDESENATTQSISMESHHRRKSSIDNEDVSQSVSDTIKRYLRMARKKSIHDNDQANRFKRVNYDRNLRNIRAKGEINPPGMDEGLNKAVQTLDAWPLITLNFIRGKDSTGLLERSHAEWQKILDERVQKKLEYEKKLELQLENNEADKANISNTRTFFNKQSESSCSSSSAPTSPTSYDRHSPNVSTSPTSHQVQAHVMRSCTSGGKFMSGSHFLSNLWHGNTSSTSLNQQHGRNEKTFHIDSNKNGQSNMQKSKSSSNVGQFVTKNILRSRSKSQTRSTTLSTSKWAPCDNYRWISDNGGTIQIMDTSLHRLSHLEAKLLQRVAVEKINELNIGVNLEINSKAQKRRILQKKKAITTSFFDIGKKDDQNARFNIFGNSLDGCLENDRKRYSNLTSTRERGSRTSLISLFRGSSSVGSTTGMLNENVRSCENLPSGTVESPSKNISATINKSTSGYFSNLKKVASAQISRSQSDMRRKSQEIEINFNLSDTTGSGTINEFIKARDSNLQVPTFVTSCIKYLEENGLQKIGLFRVSTSQKRVKQMREIFDKNATSLIEPNTCPHDVATLLKEFLRDLPEPLLCNHLYQAFLKTQKIRNRRLQLEGISHLIKLLPLSHRDTLYFLLKFLAKVASKSDDVISNDGNLEVTGNKMDSNNLATVFAPNILRNSGKANEGSTIEKECMNDAINVIRIMIDHYEELFNVPAELIDVVYSHMLDECPENLFFLFDQRNQTIKSSDNEDEMVPRKPARRLYTRASVMHQNDASKSPDMITNSSRVSKRQTESVLNPGVHTLTSNNYYEESGLLQSSLSDSRQKPPSVCIEKHGGEFDEADVLSASLQITVPKQIANMSLATSDKDDLDDVFLNVPQSLLCSEAKNLHDMSKALQNSEKTQPQLAHKNAKTKTFRSQRSSQIQANTNQGKTTIDVVMQVANANKQDGNIHSQKKNIVNEPKKPAVISNIGGAILRSKTADFEKMASKSRSNRSSILMQDTIAADAIAATSLALNVQAKSAYSNNGKKQNLYKRQQLIPSAKRNVTSPDTKQK